MYTDSPIVVSKRIAYNPNCFTTYDPESIRMKSPTENGCVAKIMTAASNSLDAVLPNTNAKARKVDCRVQEPTSVRSTGAN
jgi:hypothetical protein